VQPDGTRGLDQFIGEADMLGCGHVSALVRSFADKLLRDGTPRVVTDPCQRQGDSGLRKSRISS